MLFENGFPSAKAVEGGVKLVTREQGLLCLFLCHGGGPY